MRRRRVIVLAVPDDEKRVTFQVVLKREGYMVLEASDATGALEQIREAEPDLLITEMRLPRMAGAELIRMVRAEGGAPERILAVSTEACGPEAKAAGADDFQTLPLKPEQLIKTVARLIGRS